MEDFNQTTPMNGGDPVLSPQDRKKLDSIVQKMVENRESDDNIKFVVEDFKKKYAVKQPKKAPAGGNGASPSVSVVGGSSSASQQPNQTPKRKPLALAQMEEEKLFQPKIGQEQKTVNRQDVVLEKKQIKKEPVIQKQAEKINQEVEKNYYNNTLVNDRWKDAVQPTNEEVIAISKDFSTDGMPMEFMRYVKNETDYLSKRGSYGKDDGEILRNEYEKDKVLGTYVSDKIEFLRNKIKYSSDENEKQFYRDEFNKTVSGYQNFRRGLTALNAKEKELKQRNKELYERANNGEGNALYHIKKAVTSFAEGAYKPISDILQAGLENIDEGLKQAGVEGGVGAGVDRVRFNNDLLKMENDDGFSTAYGSGKLVKYGKDTFIVTADGNVYNQKTGSSIVSFTDKETLDNIRGAAEASKETGSFNSGVALTRGVANTTGQIISQVALTRGFGGAGAVTGTKFMKTASAVNATLLGTSSYNDTVSKLMEKGVSESDARASASEMGFFMAGVGALTGAMSPNSKTAELLGQEFKENLVKKAITAYADDGITGVKALIKTTASELPKVLKEAGLENAQEIGETYAQSFEGGRINREHGVNALDEDVSGDELVNIMLISSLASGVPAGAGALKNGVSSMFGMDVKETFNAATEMDDSDMVNTVKSLVSNKTITPEKGDEMITKLRNYKAYKNKITDDLKGEQAIEVTQLMAERDNLKNQKKNLDEAFHPEMDTKIEEVNQKINSTLANGKETTPTENTTETQSETTEGKTEGETEVKGYTRTNDVEIKGAPKGTYVNIGLNIGTSQDTMSEQEVLSKLPEGVKVISQNTQSEESVLNGETNVEKTLSLQLSRPLTDEEMRKLTEDTQQKAIPQIVDGKGAMHGTDEWGDFNPQYFGMPNGKKLSNNLETVSEKTNSELTEDDDNNYVFYHYSPVEFDKLDPSKSGSNKAARTDRTEIGAWSSAGGVNYLYTRDNQREGVINGDYGYEFKVPKDKVYDTDADVNNYGEEADKRYAEANHGAKPNANIRTALITQIASENGYEVTVTPWNGGVRAQTNQALVPSDKSIVKSNVVVKDFKNKYQSNYDKNLQATDKFDFNNFRELTNYLQDKYYKSGKIKNLIGMSPSAVVRNIMSADIPDTYKKVAMDTLKKDGLIGQYNSIPQDVKEKLEKVKLPNESKQSNETGTTTEETGRNQEGEDTSNEPVLSKPESEEISKIDLSESLGLNKLNDILDKWDNDLSKFGKENLGMNLPVVVAKGAIKAMKVAAKTAKVGADVLSAGVNYVKETDWYKNLSTEDKDKFDADGLIQSLNETQESFSKQAAETAVKAETVPPTKKTKGIVRENTGQTDTSNKVLTTEAKLLKEKFTNLQRGYKQGVKDIQELKKDFVDYVKDNIDNFSTYLTPRETARLIDMVGKINNNNVDKVTNAVDNIVARLEGRADKAKLASIKKLQQKANKKYKNVYGSTYAKIKQLTKIDPLFIPANKVDEYHSMIEKLAKGQAVDVSQVNAMAESLSDEIADYVSFKNETKNTGKSSDLDKRENSSNELNVAKASVKSLMNGNKFANLSAEAKQTVKDFFKIPQEYFDMVSTSELAKVTKALDYLGSSGQLSNATLLDFVTKYKAYNTAQEINKTVGQKIIKAVGTYTQQIAAALGNGKSSTQDFTKAIGNTMLQHVDTVLKGVKGTLFYDNIIHPITSNMTKASHISGEVGKKLSADFNKAAKGKEFKTNVKFQIYFRQKEFEANPSEHGGKVFSVDEHIKATLGNRNNSDYDEDSINEIEAVYNKMKGQSAQEMYDNMSPEEKKFINTAEKIVKEYGDKNKFYNDHVVGETPTYLESFFPRRNDNYKKSNVENDIPLHANGAPSITGSSSNDRSANKATPLNFNTVGNLANFVKEVNIEHTVGQSLKEVRMTINNLKGSNNESIVKLANALENTVNNILKAQLASGNQNYDGKLDRIFNAIQRNTYKRILVDFVKRLPVDVMSNFVPFYTAHVDKIPAIIKASKVLNQSVLGKVFEDFGSTQMDRLLSQSGGGSHSADYKSADSSNTSQYRYNKANPSFGEGFIDLMNHNKIGDFSEEMNTLYYSIADKPAVHLWKLHFMEGFKAATGKEFSADMYMNNEDYRNEHKEAMKTVVANADKMASNLFNTASTSERKLKVQQGSKDFIVRANNFLRSFTNNEFKVFWDSFKGTVGMDSSFQSQSDAARALFIVNARGIMYSYLGAILGDAIVKFAADDDDDEVKLMNEKALKRSIASHGLLITFGNSSAVTNMIASLIFEAGNQMYKESKGEKYNPYQDSYLYAPNSKSKISDALNYLGAEGNAVKVLYDTTNMMYKIFKKFNSDEPLTKEDLIDFKAAQISASFVAQSTGLPVEYFGKLGQKVLDKKAQESVKGFGNFKSNFNGGNFKSNLPK